MNIRWATNDERGDWNGRILANPDGGNVFQSLEFAQQKQRGGWLPRFIVAGDLSVTVLEKSIPLLGKLWYIPKGPGITDARQLDNLLTPLLPYAKTQGVFLIKLEPELLKTAETMADLLKLRLSVASPIQPNFSTVTLDLSPDLETLLARLNQKGRHAIRRAERDGVTVQRVKATDENCRVMYDLLHNTAAGSFRIRSYEYYRSFWQRFSTDQLGQLFFAYVDGVVVAGAYALVFGTKSTYKDGASVRERPVYGASHLLQWHVIRWAKERGALVHDFCGAPPASEINNPEHPHYGIGRFKTSFNKEITEYVGVFDCVVRTRQYDLWQRFGERAAVHLHQSRHHENYY